MIIVSFVRSRPTVEKRPEGKDESSMPTTILHDLRRLNVAITRAKHKVQSIVSIDYFQRLDGDRFSIVFKSGSIIGFAFYNASLSWTKRNVLLVIISHLVDQVILIGNPQTLREFPPLASVLTALESTDSLITLPQHAHEDLRLIP